MKNVSKDLIRFLLAPMYHFSYNVNKRRRLRHIKRQCIRQLIIPRTDSSDDDFDNESNEQTLQQSQNFEPMSSTAIDIDHLSSRSLTDYVEDASDCAMENEYEDDSRPLYVGSPMSVTTAVRLISEFCLNSNLDKQKVARVFRLIKSLLPKPNNLPTSRKDINNVFRQISFACFFSLH
jgi:hypothetical protein